MLRTTISMPDNIAQYLDTSRKSTSETLQDLVLDYQYALLSTNSAIDIDKKATLEQYLDEEIFKVRRLFDAKNNLDKSLAMVAIIELQNIPFTKKWGIFCIEQFLEFHGLYKDRLFFKKCLCQKMVEEYLIPLNENDDEILNEDDQLIQLKEYHCYLKEADKLVLKVRKEAVQEVYAYKDGQLVDYFMENTSLSYYKKRIENLTGTTWIIVDKEPGNTDCALIRKTTNNK